MGAGPLEIPLVEQRRYRRFSTMLDVEIYRQDEYGLPCLAHAVVRNVSGGGFGILLDRKPPVGSLLTVRTLKSSMQCIVQHACPDEGRRLVGVEILPAADGTSPTQSLERIATDLSAARRTSTTADEDEDSGSGQGVR